MPGCDAMKLISVKNSCKLLFSMPCHFEHTEESDKEISLKKNDQIEHGFYLEVKVIK